MLRFSSNEQAAVERKIDSARSRCRTSCEIDIYYELDRCEEWIRENRLCKICLQFPDELLPDSIEVALQLECRIGTQPYILGDTSYGSCCVDMVAAQHVKADGIIHFGHACLSPTSDFPVLFIFEKYPINAANFVSQFRGMFKERDKKILLLYDVDYHHAVDDVVKNLSPDFPNLIVPILMCSGVLDCTDQQSQILGRLFTLPENATVEEYSIVFIGKDGSTLSNFALTFPGEAMYVYDPSASQKLEAYTVRNSKFLMKRMHLVERVKDAQTLGILVGTLGVSNYLEAVKRVKQLAKHRRKKCYIFAVGKPNVAKLANFPEIDVFVLIACSENSLLDSKEFYRPIVTPYEVELAYNASRSWSEKYVLEFQNLLADGSNYKNISDFAEDDGAADVSLVTGRVRVAADPVLEQTSQAVATKNDGTVSTVLATGSRFLSERSWQGLEVNLGQNEVSKATKGRSGIPWTYDTDRDALDQ